MKNDFHTHVRLPQGTHILTIFLVGPFFWAIQEPPIAPWQVSSSRDTTIRFWIFEDSAPMAVTGQRSLYVDQQINQA